MPHTLILGMTESGKTTLARKLARRYQHKGIPVLVLDPYKSSAWQADFITDSPDLFLETVKASKSCAVFVDECGHYADEGYSDILRWLATNSRHYGHNSHFIAQRAQQLKPTIRDQCSHIFLFKQSFDDAKELTRNFATDALLEAPTLKKGEYLGKVGIDGEVFKDRVF